MKCSFLSCAIGLAISSSAFATGIDYPLFGGDPLTPQQWHLKNTGQSGYSLSNGTAGNDLNLDFAHAMGIKGRGITVAVIDTGLQTDHPDLSNNIVNGSLNFADGSDYPLDTNGHGTSVGGLVAAVEGNSIGGRGVSPLANLIGFNFLSHQTLGNWAISHGGYNGVGNVKFTDARVFNQSYGSTPPLPPSYQPENDFSIGFTESVYSDISLNSHVGRGSAFVKSAGNSFRYYQASYFGFPMLVLPFEHNQFFNNQGLPFHNSNLSLDNVNYWNLVVSSLNANGELASYSSVGSSVMLSAPGGEYGDSEPAMVTTDLVGCDAGYNQLGDHPNALHGGNSLDPNCDFNGVMNGTSSAAPNTSGALAVVMSANHALDARTVRHLLIKNARRTDPDHPGVNLTFEDASGTQVNYDAIPSWQTNAAGYSFHSFYGLGAVNVDGAVMDALFTSASLPELQTSEWHSSDVSAQIPDADLQGVISGQQVDSDLTIEMVQVKLNLDHSRLRDLAIELISPAGTRSILMSARTGTVAGNQGGYTDALMASSHFYGESSKGLWKLRVIDTDKGNSLTLGYLPDFQQFVAFNGQNNALNGVLRDWSIRIFGH